MQMADAMARAKVSDAASLTARHVRRLHCGIPREGSRGFQEGLSEIENDGRVAVIVGYRFKGNLASFSGKK